MLSCQEQSSIICPNYVQRYNPHMAKLRNRTYEKARLDTNKINESISLLQHYPSLPDKNYLRCLLNSPQATDLGLYIKEPSDQIYWMNSTSSWCMLEAQKNESLCLCCKRWCWRKYSLNISDLEKWSFSFILQIDIMEGTGISKPDGPDQNIYTICVV